MERGVGGRWVGVEGLGGTAASSTAERRLHPFSHNMSNFPNDKTATGKLRFVKGKQEEN